ncbi:MAG: glycerol-3-phosphate dehydrogenase [Omnitrophica WOR_2 bacterium RIFCSPHIGHO2_02_FULL_50_17]|nr:MAG: glycerol-3-phosphate dehydrogenase [Omnitrophica WOR_2 bacterium RIFCSPHIGHO2_02_FULL_50_17]
MIRKIQHIAVIGDGGWGTTLAVYLAQKGYAVSLWGPFPEYVRQMRQNRYNPRFLPGIRLPQTVEVVDCLEASLEKGDLIVFAVPSKYALKVMTRIQKTRVPLSHKAFLSVTKGIETTKLMRMSEMIHQRLGNLHLAVLSGPTIAMEVAKGIPSTAVVASRDVQLAKTIQAVFNSQSFRIYTNTDITGVELGGSIKNIIAIACGVCDGLGLGTNTKAAIMTRGLAEMARLGKVMGAKVKTFWGLTGLGDLVTTCMNAQSRNRYVGEQLGLGKPIRTIVGSMEMVAEGVETVKAVYRLSQKYKVPMPITHEVYQIIYKHKKPKLALTDLMTRKMKPE